MSSKITHEIKELLKIALGYAIILLCAIPYGVIAMLFFGTNITESPWVMGITVLLSLVTGYVVLWKTGKLKWLGHGKDSGDEVD